MLLTYLVLWESCSDKPVHVIHPHLVHIELSSALSGTSGVFSPSQNIWYLNLCHLALGCNLRFCQKDAEEPASESWQCVQLLLQKKNKTVN